MLLRYLLAFLVSIMLAPFPLQAAQTYGSFQADLVQYEETFSGGSARWAPLQISGALGGMLNPYVGLEGRLGFGLTDSEVDVFGTDVAVESDGYYGGFARLNLTDDENFIPYGLIGYTDGSLTATGNNEVTIDWSGTSYGAGLSFSFGKTKGRNYHFIEYIHYFDESSATVEQEMTSINFGTTVYFSGS